MRNESVHILLDNRSWDHINKEGNLQPPFSHDKVVIAFGLYLSSCGFDVEWATLSTPEKIYSLNKKNGIYVFDSEKTLSKTHFLLCTSDVVNLPPRKNRSTIQMAFQPAVFLAEQPEDLEPFGLIKLVDALRYNTDFVVTQNERMKEVLFLIYSLLAGWKDKSRILVSPLGIDDFLFTEEDYSLRRIETRQELGLNEDDILVINAGGVWRWTDMNKFARAVYFENTISRKKRFVLLQPSLKQDTNSDHDGYIKEFMTIGEAINKNFGTAFRVHGSWADSANKLDSLLSASDLGVNVSKDTFENWMSHRVRFLEYLRAGIPLINSPGDSFSKAGIPGVLVPKSNTIGAYQRELKSIAGRTHLFQLTREMRNEIPRFRNEVFFRNLMGSIHKGNSGPRMAEVWIKDIIDPDQEKNVVVDELMLIVSLRNIIVSHRALYISLRLLGGRVLFRRLLKSVTR
jgi:hypothetical protein